MDINKVALQINYFAPVVEYEAKPLILKEIFQHLWQNPGMHPERIDHAPLSSAVPRPKSDEARLDGGGSTNRSWDELRRTGATAADWADANGFSRALVYAVLRGNRKCLRGQSHQIAIALGLKQP